MKSLDPRGAFPVLILGLALLPIPAWAAKELQKGQFTFIQNQVEVSSGGSKLTPKNKDFVEEKSVVDTGDQSLSQVDFSDSSVLRLGPKTRVSFLSKERVVKIEEGSLLMNIPHGNGGITIEGDGVSATVTGSTVMASRDSRGNFGFVVLETQGAAKVAFAGGQSANLVPGQIALVRKTDGSIRVLDLNLDAVVHSSALFESFPTALPGFDAVAGTADGQAAEVQSETKSLLSYEEVGLKSDDPEKSILGLLFGKSPEEMAAAKNPFLGDLATAAGSEENKDSSGSSNVVLGAEGGQEGSVSDARQAEGEAIASKSNPPSGDAAGSLGGTDTAAGSESLSGTDTAAGGGGAPDTQAPAPVGGGTTVNPPPATPTGGNA